jgi:hypothetical protein
MPWLAHIKVSLQRSSTAPFEFRIFSGFFNKNGAKVGRPQSLHNPQADPTNCASQKISRPLESCTVDPSVPLELCTGPKLWQNPRHRRFRNTLHARDRLGHRGQWRWPIYLTTDELAEFKGLPGFDIPLESSVTLTGHIDLLQIRNGAIHIVDYKPGAKSEKPIPQLMTYALALSRRTGLRLFHFVCSWFDQDHYYQFFPLHVVYKRGQAPDGEKPAGLRSDS